MCPEYSKAREFINVLSNIANFTLNGTHGAFMLFHAYKGMREEFHPNYTEDGVEIEFSDQIDLEHYQRTVNETIQDIYDQRPPACYPPDASIECCRSSDGDKCCYGATDIVRALNTSLNMMFQSSSGMREDAEQVAVLITDGYDSFGTEKELNKTYKELAKVFKARKIKVLAIGVGDVNKKHLSLLVQSPEHFFQVESFDGLEDDVTQLIGAIICKGTFILLVMIKLFTPNELQK